MIAINENQCISNQSGNETQLENAIKYWKLKKVSRKYNLFNENMKAAAEMAETWLWRSWLAKAESNVILWNVSWKAANESQ